MLPMYMVACKAKHIWEDIYVSLFFATIYIFFALLCGSFPILSDTALTLLIFPIFLVFFPLFPRLMNHAET